MPAGVAFNEDYQEAFLDLVRGGRNPRTAAPIIGFRWETVKRRLQDDVDFRAALSEAELHAVAKVEDALFRNAVEGDLGAQKFYLTNRKADRWADDRTRAAGAGTGGGGGAGHSDPEILVAAVREALEGGTRTAAVAMLTKVPLPGQALPEAIDTTATERTE